MIDICDFLTVCNSEEPTGVIIEKCGEYNGALKEFVLVLEPDKIPILENWIRNNVRQMQDHCIQMLENEPQSTFRYLMRMKNLKECTSEFVADAGGIQQFLDKYEYVLPKHEESTSESTEEANTNSLPDDTADSKEETSSAEEVEIVHSKSLEDEQDTMGDTDVKSEAATVRQATNVPNSSSEPEQVAVMKQDEPEIKESTPEPIVIKKQTKIVEETIHRKVQNVMDYNPDLIEKISDGDIQKSVEKLKELENKIALGGLDPNLVLTDEDLQTIYKRVYTYAPDVFKSFFLAYLKSVTSETERFRISAVVDDFVKFIGR